MCDDRRDNVQPTPKGLEIPVPTREEFLRNMDKVAPPVAPPRSASEPSGQADADEQEGWPGAERPCRY